MIDYVFGYLHQIFVHPFIKTAFSFIFLSVQYLIWWFDLVVHALLILLILDFVMWFSVAFTEHKISRKKMMGWLVKMIVYFVGISMGHWTDILIIHQDIEFGFKNFIIVYLGVTESLSIIKHMVDLGVKMPSALISRLESYRDKLDIK